LETVHVVYPPVEVKLDRQSASWIPFEKRANSFVLLGRIVPRKAIERAVVIVDRLRGLGHDVELHIAGGGDRRYIEHLKNTLIAERGHVKLHLDLPRSELEKLIVGTRYGLHCFQYEHFGMAAAELQKLGCIVFVPNAGGQVEAITNAHQRYDGVDDAVAKIDRVLRDQTLQLTLLAEAARTGDRFSRRAFACEVRQHVREAIRHSATRCEA
jgi:glycosyltransferase involved in cell wall biosynthesis